MKTCPSSSFRRRLPGRKKFSHRLKKPGFPAQMKKQITIDDIAAYAEISVSTLLRLYHDILHTTPIQHVLQYRLEQIREELLSYSGSSISEIAYSCGFNDISYFNRCFLKKYGCTPSEFRRNQYDNK